MDWTLDRLKAYFAAAKTGELGAAKTPIHAVAWSPDGLKLASASADHSIRIWPAESITTDATAPFELKGHSGAVEKIAWTQDQQLVSISTDRTVRLLDTTTGEILWSWSTPNFTAINLAIDPSGSLLALGGKDDTVKILHMATAKELLSHKYDFEVNQMSWNQEGRLLFLTTGNGTIVSLPISADSTSLDMEAFSHTLHGHTSNCFCISASGRFMAVGAADALVSLWDLDQMASVGSVGRLEWPIRAVALSHCGRLVAASSEDPFIDIAEVETGQQIARIPVRGPVHSLAWHPSKWLLAYAANEKDSRSSNRSESLIRFYNV